MFIGQVHVEDPYIGIGAAATVYYFGYFLVIVPVIGVIENTLMDMAQTNKVTSPSKTSMSYPTKHPAYAQFTENVRLRYYLH
ncbi:hypothetical protein CBS101457_006971 (mitochondrion) [Exobasidium rhododendri]|nr:hypothetical protein CBS101457_006971 [Exobasidium rhododendri]